METSTRKKREAEFVGVYQTAFSRFVAPQIV